MSEVFISYVRDDNEPVERLAAALRAHGVKVWLDKTQIRPGQNWKNVIREAISKGAFFVACFSKRYLERTETYMNEELNLAFGRMRQQRRDIIWFIPVLLNECEVPDLEVSPQQSLRDIDWVPLYEDWEGGVRRILSVLLPPATEDDSLTDVPDLADEDWRVLLYSIQRRICTPVLGRATLKGVIPFSPEATREAMLERLKYKEPPDFDDPAEIHSVLASLPLPVYLTTNYDDFLLRALRARGKRPTREFCRWNERLRMLPEPDDSETEPTADAPLVFHLFGHAEAPESMVVTEDDFIDFVAAVAAEKRVLPLRIQRALVSTLLLYLDYRHSDELFRRLSQAIYPYTSRSLRKAIARYRRGPLADFSALLKGKWEEFSHGD